MSRHRIGYAIYFSVKPWDGPNDPKYAWPKIFKTQNAAFNWIEFVPNKLFLNSGRWGKPAAIPNKRIVSAHVAAVYTKD